MKILAFFFGFLLAISFSLSAQTLDFSRVINLSGDCGIDDHVVDTVPAGKAWKLETFITEDVLLQVQVQGGPLLYVNNYWDTRPASAPGNTGTSILARALWLREGTIIRADCQSAVSTDNYFLSILEFTVTP